jgi:hypothetical protein
VAYKIFTEPHRFMASDWKEKRVQKLHISGKGGRETRRCEREKAGKNSAVKRLGFTEPELLKSGSTDPSL